MKKEETPIARKLSNISIIWGAFGNGNAERCAGIVERIDQPETGGIFTKYYGCNYLYKGYADVTVVYAIYGSKKVLSGLFILISQNWIKFIFGGSFLFFAILPQSIKKKILISFWDYFLGIGYMPLLKYILPENKYCISAKELYRVSEKLFKNIKDESELSRARNTRDVILMIWEYDAAYRLRAQDVLSLLNKEKLQKNPNKEISRIFDILIEREKNDKGKYEGLKKILMIGLKFGKVRDFIVQSLMEIDLEKIKPDEADWYFCLDRDDYDYVGFLYSERMEIAAEMDRKMKNQRPNLVFKDTEKKGREKLVK